MPNEFKEIDEGFDEFVEDFKELDGAKITVGVHGKDNDDAEDGNINLATLMSVHEFGTTIDHPGGTPYVMTETGPVFVEKGTDNIAGRTDPHTIKIPPRPAIRTGIKSNRDEINRTYKKALLSVLRQQRSLRNGLSLVGQKTKNKIQDVFGDKTKLDANAASTIAKKGSSAPLIDNGQLRRAIDFVVHAD